MSDTIDPHRNRTPNVWYVATVSGMASFIDMFALYATATALVIYQKAYAFTNWEYGVLTSTITFAVAIGALVGGRLGDRFGRKRVFSVTMLVIILGSIVLMFSHTFVPLFIGMALIGLGTGADLPVSISTSVEAAKQSQRGKVVGLSEILWLLGAIVEDTLAIAVGGQGVRGARILFAAPGVIALIIFLLRLAIPESETWIKAQQERAAGVRTVRAQESSVRDLWKPPYRKPFIMLVGFYGLQNICSNTVGQLGTWVNVNIIHMSVSLSSAIGFATLIIGIICGLIFMRFVDTKWRKWLLYIGAAFYIPGFLGFVIGGFTPAMWMVAGSCAQIGSLLSGEPMMKILTQESFPTLLRTTAQGAVISTGRLTAAIAAIFTETLVAAAPTASYVGLTVIAALAYVFLFTGFKDARGDTYAFQTETHSLVA